jgi:hypothetical protein
VSAYPGFPIARFVVAARPATIAFFATFAHCLAKEKILIRHWHGLEQFKWALQCIVKV